MSAKLHLAGIGLAVLLVGCMHDGSAALVEKAHGRWRCEQGDDPRWKPFEVQVDDGTFTWFGPDGEVVAESTWALDGTRLELGLENPVGEAWAFRGVSEDADRITAEIVPDEPHPVDVRAVGDDAVTFREGTPGSVTWTCRRRQGS